MQPKSIIRHSTDGTWLDVLGMQIKFLCTSDDTNSRYSGFLNTVPKGTGPPRHKHPWDETFYVLKGGIELQLDDELHALSKGDFAVIPADRLHAFRGMSNEESLLFVVDVPSHSYAFFKEIHDTVINLPQDLDKMPGIGGRHHVTFS